MTNATEDFFDELGRRRRDERLAMASGTLRCDLTHGQQTEHWFVKIENGVVAVSRKDAKANAVVRADRALFDRIVTGEVNLTAAFLRGETAVEGDLELICLFERLLSGPLNRHGRQPAASGRRRQP